MGGSDRAESVYRGMRAALLAGMLAVLAACGGGGGAGPAEGPIDPASVPGAPQLQTSWSAAMHDYNTTAPGLPVPPPLVFEDQTLRQTMHVTVGGESVRVLLSNLFGTQPLAIAGVHIARHAGGTAIAPQTDTPLTFSGQPAVVIAPGAQVWSDEVPFQVPARGNLTVSVYVRERTAAATWHAGAFQRGGIARGNALSAADLTDATELLSFHWVSRIDVRTPQAGGAIVAFGDSITEGALSSFDANRRYPDLLDARVADFAGLVGSGVVNAGIGGNWLLHDGFGPRARDRFQRDVLQVTNARAVVVLMGINDLHAANAGIGPAVGAEELTKALSDLVLQGHEAGLRVYLATLLPCRGNGYASDVTEAARMELNRWIRTQTQADGVVDLDAALGDPAAPARLNPAYDSGDALHPNDAGMAAIARAFDLALLAGRNSPGQALGSR